MLTPNTCKYVEIDQVVFACLRKYLHVLGSICMYILHQVAAVVGNFYVVSICMYLHVYACIWIVNDKITINTTAKLPKTA